MAAGPDLRFKVVISGSFAGGKSAIIRRAVDGTFRADGVSTIGGKLQRTIRDSARYSQAVAHQARQNSDSRPIEPSLCLDCVLAASFFSMDTELEDGTSASLDVWDTSGQGEPFIPNNRMLSVRFLSFSTPFLCFGPRMDRTSGC